MSAPTHFWRLRCRLPERHGQPCRVVARGALNTVAIEFADGVRYFVSRWAVRRLPEIPTAAGSSAATNRKDDPND